MFQSLNIFGTHTCLFTVNLPSYQWGVTDSDPGLTHLVAWPQICPVTMNLPDDLDSWLNLAFTPEYALLSLCSCTVGQDPDCQGPHSVGVSLHSNPHPLGSSCPSLLTDTLYRCLQLLQVPAYCSGFAYSL